MAKHTIFFGINFLQSNFNKIYNENWEITISETTKSVIFDLKILEWINTEEIVFLFGWIRKIKFLKKEVNVILPFSSDVFKNNYLTSNIEIEEVQKHFKVDTDERISRRVARKIMLLRVWGLKDYVELEDYQLINFDQVTSDAKIKDETYRQILPFSVINTEYNKILFSDTYSDFLKGERNIIGEHKPFKIDRGIRSILEISNCYSPFESKMISNIITKELFLNSLLHSDIEKKYSNSECYFALSLSNKWTYTESTKFKNQFILEKDIDTLDFYKDKLKIKTIINNKIESQKINDTSIIPNNGLANLSKYDEFKNIAYIEFSFLDFGDGIVNTLKSNFDEFVLIESNKLKLNNTILENQILEYAFFSESSRSKYLSKLENPNLWSRGLFFLLDMIRRFKGLLIVRSGKGKLVYDFSDKIIIKLIDSKITAEIIEINDYKEAIKSIENSVDFTGTMFTIVLPEKNKTELSYAPVRSLDFKDIYLKSDSTPNILFAPKSYEYISLLLIYEEVITKIKPSQLENDRGFESLLYISFTEKLREYENLQCLIFIDFELYPRNDQTSHILKILSYLTNSPYITEITKAVIVNLPKEERHIIEKVKTNLFSVENEPHIYRPIPCINLYEFTKENSKIESINWIGIKDDDDEITLTSILLGRKKSINKDRIFANQKENSKTTVEGNVFAEYEDHIYSIFNADDDLVDRYFFAKSKGSKVFLKSLVENGAYPKEGDKYYLFQTSKGSYQIQYLSLYETLHNKYVARFLALQILLKFIFDNKENKNIKIQKIITVTVSSQLIGVAIRDLIFEYEIFKDLIPKEVKKNEIKTIEHCPFLIMLSSYYSFEDEKPFKEINENDNVLIVNDVISTGALIKKLFDKITNIKKANVLGIMSLADCRIQNVEPTEDESDFSINEKLCYNILGYPNEEIIIRNIKIKILLLQN